MILNDTEPSDIHGIVDSTKEEGLFSSLEYIALLLLYDWWPNKMLDDSEHDVMFIPFLPGPILEETGDVTHIFHYMSPWIG